ncbi:MAG: hypothetical protein AAF085_15905, partial [Planctomycetota bacterium]
MARDPKPFKPGLLITGRGAILVVVVLIGVTAHGALGVWGSGNKDGTSLKTLNGLYLTLQRNHIR